MTDSKHHDLRTRIAAAIMESCHGVYLDDAVNAADAVIRELKLSHATQPAKAKADLVSQVYILNGKIAAAGLRDRIDTSDLELAVQAVIEGKANA